MKPAKPPTPPRRRFRLSGLLFVFAVQMVCAVFFVSDIAMTLIGVRARPLSWHAREILEIGAALGLVLGMVLGWLAWRKAHLQRNRAEQQLRVASGAFYEVLVDNFDNWGLTPAERDVALFAIKGLTVSEIASIRNTSEGTVKAQSNAIYRKAGVSGRPQLLSHFIEDLMSDCLIEDLPRAGTADAAREVSNKPATSQV